MLHFNKIIKDEIIYINNTELLDYFHDKFINFKIIIFGIIFHVITYWLRM